MSFYRQIMFEDVETAVQASVQQDKPLLVYCVKNGVEVCGSVIDSIVPYAHKLVCVLLKEETKDFVYFKQIIPQVRVPSIWIVKAGAVLESIDLLSAESISQRLGKLFGNQVSDQMSEDTSTEATEDVLGIQEEEDNNKSSEENHSECIGKESHIFTKSPFVSEFETSKSKSHQTLISAGHHDDDVTCTLSLRLLDGSSIKHQFKSSDTLDDVRLWLDTESGVEIISSDSMPSFAMPDALHPTRYAFQSPEIPRITFDDNQEFVSLKQLNLVPRSVLILKPVFDESAMAYSDKKGYILSLASSFGKLSNAVYSFFDYFNDEDNISLNETDSDDIQHKSPTVISIDSKKIKRPTLINFENDSDKDTETDLENHDLVADLLIKRQVSNDTRLLLNRPSATRVQTLLSNERPDAKEEGL